MISLFAAFVFVVALCILISIWWYASMPSNLPPGPIGLPLFGSMFSTWRASNLHNKLHQWTKVYGPLYKLYVAEKLVLVLGDWNMIQETLVKQGDAFASRPRLHIVFPADFEPGSGLVTSDGELWKTQRRFALSTLRDFGFGRPIIEPQIKDETEYLIEAIEAHQGRPFDPATLLNNGVSNVICALVFGRRFQYDDENFKRLLRLLRTRLTETDISFLTPFVLSKRVALLLSKLPKVKQIIQQGSNLAKFVKKEIAETMKSYNKNDEPSNYIQAFYKAKEDREDNWTFTDPQLLTSVSNLFVAGTDTTATTLRWAIFYLAHNPQWQEKICDEIRHETGGGQSLLNFAERTKLPLTEATIMEVQRMANLVPLGVMRRTMVPCTVAGYDIPADTVVVPLLTAVLRDPITYPNPDAFDPRRFLNGNKNEEKGDEFTHLIPFLAGKRVCLGESLARMELFLFFTALVAKFKFSFSNDEPKPALDDECVSLIRGPPHYKICALRRTD